MHVVLLRRGLDGKGLLRHFLRDARVDEIEFTSAHWAVAAEAQRRFGRGRHPAQLNFGECLVYAIARVAGEPLPCTGDAFAKTDLEIA